jgi:hypothetical protein
MTKRNLEILMRHWIKLLKLTDWKLTIHYAKKKEAKKTWGTCEIPVPYVKVAKITIVNPNHKSWKKSSRSPEETLVHELLHLKRPLHRDNPTTEFCINDLANLLISLEKIAMERKQ